MHLYRIIFPVTDIEKAVSFYAGLFDLPGQRISPGRHYFNLEGVILACYDPIADGDDIRQQWAFHENQYIYIGAIVRRGAEVRVNGVVHVKSVVAENATVPINWIAVGDPAQLFPPQQHEEIWAIQKPLNFPGHVYGLERTDKTESLMPEVCRVMSERLAGHKEDVNST